MKTISKQALFAAKDLQFTDVPLPDEYGKGFGLRVRKLTGRERTALEKKYLDGLRATKDPEGFKWAVILETVIGDDGKPYFKDSDREAFMAKSGELCNLLWDESGDLNKLTQASVDAAAKNSMGGRGNSSSSGSA